MDCCNFVDYRQSQNGYYNGHMQHPSPTYIDNCMNPFYPTNNRGYPNGYPQPHYPEHIPQYNRSEYTNRRDYPYNRDYYHQLHQQNGGHYPMPSLHRHYTRNESYYREEYPNGENLFQRSLFNFESNAAAIREHFNQNGGHLQLLGEQNGAEREQYDSGFNHCSVNPAFTNGGSYAEATDYVFNPKEARTRKAQRESSKRSKASAASQQSGLPTGCVIPKMSPQIGAHHPAMSPKAFSMTCRKDERPLFGELGSPGYEFPPMRGVGSIPHLEALAEDANSAPENRWYPYMNEMQEMARPRYSRDTNHVQEFKPQMETMPVQPTKIKLELPNMSDGSQNQETLPAVPNTLSDSQAREMSDISPPVQKVSKRLNPVNIARKNARKNEILEKKTDEKAINKDGKLNEELVMNQDSLPLPGFQQAFGSTEIGRFSESFFNSTTAPNQTQDDNLSPSDLSVSETSDYAGNNYENYFNYNNIPINLQVETSTLSCAEQNYTTATSNSTSNYVSSLNRNVPLNHSWNTFGYNKKEIKCEDIY